MTGPMTQLIGVAIEIPQPWAHELSSWRAKVGDPQAESIPPHITLLPPTALAPDQIDEAASHLRAVAAVHRPFELHLAGTGTFRPVSEVVFVAWAGGKTPGQRLEGDVRTGPLHRAVDFPYHPHVTVAHGVSDEALDSAAEGLANFEARFAVSALTLYAHGSDRVWRRQRTFPLGLPAGA